MQRNSMLMALLALMFSIGLQAQPETIIGSNLSAGKHANAILERYEMKVEVKSLHKVVTTERYRITILNSAADEYAHLREMYDDKFWYINHLEAHLFNAQGKEIRRLRKSDIRDISAINDAVTMADATRFKCVNFEAATYPYSIEVEVEKASSQTYFIDHFLPQPGPDVAVRQASFRLERPAGLSLTLYPQMMAAPATVAEKDLLVTTVTLKDLPARARLPLEPPFHQTTPGLFVSADAFEMDGFQGRSTTWEELGQFQTLLNKERSALPEALKKQIPTVIAGKTTDRDKVAALYKWMQGQTRYISIQLGIGGWQPLPASLVGTKGYGDCKALSNFMVSVLREAGLPARYVIVQAGRGEANTNRDHPALRRSNHVICMVPLAKDTVWLECTSQNAPPNHLGSFTDNRYVLVVNDEGKSGLARTMRYTPANSQQHTKGEVVLDEQGNLAATLNNHMTGLYFDNRSELESLPADQRRRNRDAHFQMSEYEYQQLSYEAYRGYDPFVREQCRITSPHYAAAAGRRLLFAPNINNRTALLLDTLEPRSQPLLIARGSLETDSLLFSLPAGYTLEKTPPPTVIESVFGRYEMRMMAQGNQWLFTRRFQENEGHFPADSYNAFCRFYAQVARADAARAVMVKSQ